LGDVRHGHVSGVEVGGAFEDAEIDCLAFGAQLVHQPRGDVGSDDRIRVALDDQERCVGARVARVVLLDDRDPRLGLPRRRVEKREVERERAGDRANVSPAARRQLLLRRIVPSTAATAAT
jgi:hypothetical protein